MVIKTTSVHEGDYVMADIKDLMIKELYIDKDNKITITTTTIDGRNINELRDLYRKICNFPIMLEIISEKEGKFRELMSGELIYLNRAADSYTEQGSKSQNSLSSAMENRLYIDEKNIIDTFGKDYIENTSPERMHDTEKEKLMRYSHTLERREEVTEYLHKLREILKEKLEASLQTGISRVQDEAERENNEYDIIMNSLNFLRKNETQATAEETSHNKSR